MKKMIGLLVFVFLLLGNAGAATPEFPVFNATNKVVGVEVNVVNEAQDLYQISVVFTDGTMFRSVCDRVSVRDFSVAQPGKEFEADYKTGASDNPKNSGEWAMFADRMQIRFTNIARKYIADGYPWKYIGVARQLKSFELTETLVFEGGGEIKTVWVSSWVGPRPELGKTTTLATDANGELHFAVERREGKYLLDAETVAELDERTKFALSLPKVSVGK